MADSGVNQARPPIAPHSAAGLFTMMNDRSPEAWLGDRSGRMPSSVEGPVMSSHLSARDPFVPPDLIIEVARADSAGCAVTLSGEIDIVSAEALYRALIGAITQHGPVVALNAAEVRFCDARGLSALIRAANHAHALGGGIILVAASRQLNRLISLTGLERRFAPAPRRAGAETGTLSPPRHRAP
jgi:anti-anti-sigma factor